jgi:hypothetical protein
VRACRLEPGTPARDSRGFPRAAFWRKSSKNKKVRCEEGDPLGRIIQAVMDQVAVGMVEPMVNGFITAANAVLRPPLSFFGFKGFSTLCFATVADPGRCREGGLSQIEAASLAQCLDDSRGLQNLCYFERM